MRRSLVIGSANVGKTLFCIHFARYLGLRQLRWFVEQADGTTEQRQLAVEEAVRLLSGPAAHRTRQLQTVSLDVPRGKVNRQVLLTDTTGLAEGIHTDPLLREAMAQTLQALAEAQVILHIVDAARIGTSADKAGDVGRAARAVGWSPVDEQLADYGQAVGGYLILANKMDLPGAKQGYQFLRKRYSKQRVVPISALTGSGFREVRQHVWRYA
ncbi:MAG: 50S ribosome-binding GTPase [Alicyclobacillus sp.]|nr:50S ribosome-binding GTPase [Alicyclobacillus sp.]